MTVWSLLLIAAASAAGGEILIPAPDAPALEYKAYLQARPELQSPATELENQRPARASRDRLIRMFSAAQSAYLSQDPDGARKSFEALVAETTSDDWRETDRQILLISHLRLAQLAVTPEQRRSILRASSALGDAETDPKLFPPPLWNEWRESLRDVPERELRFAGLGREWDRVWINGVSCKRNPCVFRADPFTLVRITWVSDRWRPVTKVTTVENAEKIQPDREAWLLGRCGQPDWSPASGIFGRRRLGFFGLACGSGASLDLKILPSSPVAWPEEPKKSARPLYKSPWLWIGVGTLAAIVVASQSKPKDKEPTTTYGY